MKKFFVFSVVLFFAVKSVYAQTPLKNLLYSEDKIQTATHIKLYSSSELSPNRNITFSVVITATVPSPLASGNALGEGLIALIVPETAEVDYSGIRVYYATFFDSEDYTEYVPESQSSKVWFSLLGKVISKIPYLGLIMDLAPLYETRFGNPEQYVDRNKYDIVSANWERLRFGLGQKVQVDIPFSFGNDVEVGLYAYWQSRAMSTSRTGPIHARDNAATPGFITIEEVRKVGDMVLIPEGWFIMGSNDGDEDERPVHKVHLDAFWIDKYEVTNTQFKKFRSGWRSHSDNADHPVVNVSWYDARDYCKWAGKRLPTEAEWEKAARGTDEKTYPWGEGISSTKANYGSGETTPVGSYPAGVSPYGAYDMAGNVWEWVNDWYDEDYYQSSPSHNPRGPSYGDTRVLRGGSWFNFTNYLRAAIRSFDNPSYTNFLIGFRCARR